MTTPGPHGHRRSIRLPAYDYSTSGAYFVTIAAHQQRALFGRMSGLRVELSTLGTLVREEWLMTPKLRQHVELDQFVVMPNHLHAILWLVQPDDSSDSPPTLGR